MGTLGKIRRMHIREKLSIREIARRVHLSRNTVKCWLKKAAMEAPRYPKRAAKSIVDPYREQLQSWLETDSHRPKRDRRTAKIMFEAVKELGYTGSYGVLCVYVRKLRQALHDAPHRKAFVPLKFAHGEAFQFDWSREYASIAGLRTKIEMAHCKLASSRAFLLVAYPTQSHEMLFDAHTRAFTAFGGIPQRGIYDNMKTAVDRIKRETNGHKRTVERVVNARFLSMCGHYLFEPDFCNVASGWEKGIVEKNVQDRRRQIGVEMAERSWTSFAELNTWLSAACQQSWDTMGHPEWPLTTVADVLQDERAHLMPMPRLFDGYVERSVRVSSTSLIHFQRNKYSVPTPYAHCIVSLHIYPDTLVVVADDGEIAHHPRSFSRDQTLYDWQHYIPVIVQKLGALRNGAPFLTMPDILLTLRRHLLKQAGGDKVMAQVLSAIPLHGVEAVLVAVECALETGHPSAEHIFNIVARLNEEKAQDTVATSFVLREESVANVCRYEQLRHQPESCDVL